MIAESWIEQANQQPLSEIAQALGLEVRRDRIGPCPACGERQERSVRRLCVGLVRGDRQWVCNRCGTGGDGVALVSWSTLGRATRGLDPEQWRALREWFGDPRPAPQAVPGLPPQPDYPPQAEVIRLWGGFRRPDLDSPVAGWLSERRIDVARAAALDLVRESPQNSPVPLGAGERRVQAPGWPWVAALPLWDCAGSLRSLVFRAVQAPPEWLPRKSLALRGYARAGLVFADPLALGLLRGLSGVEAKAGDAGVRWDGKVFIVEGEPDFLTLATLPDRVSGGATSAVFGTVSATALLAAVGRRIPADAAVYLCPDQDEPGRRAMHRTRQEALSHVDRVFSIDIRSLQ